MGCSDSSLGVIGFIGLGFRVQGWDLRLNRKESFNRFDIEVGGQSSIIRGLSGFPPLLPVPGHLWFSGPGHRGNLQQTQTILEDHSTDASKNCRSCCERTSAHEEAKVLHHDTRALRPGLSSGEDSTLAPIRLGPSEHEFFVVRSFTLRCSKRLRPVARALRG